MAMFTRRTLDFAAFQPSYYLQRYYVIPKRCFYRIILMDGHTGSAAAGRVVEAFGHFLVVVILPSVLWCLLSLY
ncbi:hypothetical protein [Proteus hauseri]|uniref:hypothetical protein n=1 Tax=Proteus hauseri TaxID=183417 RepID=UPI001FC9128B|nr:hypothetical protein [Proteus hauseri]